MYKIDFSNPINVHFIGIGGISMSGLAEILLKRNFHITGSDNTRNAQCEHLESLGAEIHYPQAADNIAANVELIVYTAAIHDDNPELIAAKASGAPLLTRAQLLGQIMDNYSESVAVAGTHGKTSTTSMISQIWLECKEDPTISVGGIFSAIGSNIHVGNSQRFITEACEYTNSYHNFFAKYSVILNIEADHLDFFKDLADVRASFHKFASNTDSDGALIINAGIDNVEEIYDGLPCSILTFGLNEGCDCYAKAITFSDNGNANFIPIYKGKTFDEINLSVPGEHNVENALAAFAVCMNMGIDFETIKRGLEKFKGADRRFEYKGVVNGITIIDDYAHHPTEIKACIAAAQNYPHKKLIVAFQSHTYTRTKALFNEFVDALSAADEVIIAKIYAAREEDIYGISGADLSDALNKKGCKSHYFDTFEEIEKFILKNYSHSDLLITMGAGDIVNVGNELLK